MKTLLMISAFSIGLLDFPGLPKTMATAEQAPLTDTRWELKKIDTGNGLESVSVKAFIRFHAEKNSAGGNGSCNQFGSTVQRNGSKISFSNIVSTKMFCEGSQKTEDAFFRHLEKVTRFKIEGKTLYLLQDNRVLLEFVAAKG